MSEMYYRSVQEKSMFIDLPGAKGLRIHGILRGGLQQPLVVMMHGRTGDANSLLQYLGARYLYERGFSSLRLDMYSNESNTRNIFDCTLDIHAADFDCVVAYFRDKGIKTLFATGHSYGGATILKSKSRLDGAVLWDPTHGSYWTEHPDVQAEYPEKTVDDIVVGLSGNGYVIPLAMNEYDLHVGDTTEWAANKGYPLEILSAGAGSMSHLGAKYIEAADEPKKHIILEGAHHGFQDSDAVMLRLFEETTDWFKEILDA